MAANRFTSLSEENITQLLNDKDSENTKKFMKHHRLIFESYLKEKNIRNPSTAVELAAVLRSFTPRQERKMDRCTQKVWFFKPRYLLNFRRRDFIYTFHQNLRRENNFSSQYIAGGCEICENKAHFLL